jgi:hypothetical protein
MHFVEKIKGLLFEPSKTFDTLRESSLRDALKHYFVLSTISSILFAILFSFVANNYLGSAIRVLKGTAFGIFFGQYGFIYIFIIILISSIIGVFLSGTFLHISIYIVGGRKGYFNTLKAVMYGQTPALLLGWIPYISFISIIWSLIVEFVGIHRLQELTIRRTILAFLIFLLISVVLAIATVAALFISIARFSGMNLR